MVHRYLSMSLALVLFFGFGQSVMAEDTVPRPVRSMTVRAEQPPGMIFTGEVQARVETDLAFRTLGRVIARKVDVGDLVSKDDIVAQIDPLALRLAVTSAEADLRNAQAELENAAITEKRKRILASLHASSVADFDLAEQGLRSAEANVTQAQARLAKVREQLGYAQLKAEFDGVVTATSVEVGQTVTAGQAVLRVARLDRRDVVIDVPEARLASLPLGTPFDIVLQLDNTLRTAGVVREIGPEADASTRSHRLKIAVNEAPEIFRLGAVVTATKLDGQSDRMIVLPTPAILAKDGADHVWVIDREKCTVSLRLVHLEARPGDTSYVRILSGLQAGEEVAVAGVNELTEGLKVRLGQERTDE